MTQTVEGCASKFDDIQHREQCGSDATCNESTLADTNRCDQPGNFTW